MSEKYLIKYEALTYNMPACKNFEFLEHTFAVNPVTPETEKVIVPDKEPLKVNYAFLSCCVNDENGNKVFITAKNKTALELSVDDISDEELLKQAIDIVRVKMDAVEQHLIFTTNLHIFFPVVQIHVYSCVGEKKLLYGYTNNRPMPFQKWTWASEDIDIERRLNMNIDKNLFDAFRLHKNHTRYNIAFDYYIRSFYEFDHSSAFCLLCSAIDAITGSSSKKRQLTKERLAKYSSILFCKPLEIEELNIRMRAFYNLRSKFTHGKGSEISTKDEISLREYVRKFLIAYYLFWTAMEIKNEPQMLQKLDEIFDDHSLYVKYALSAYSFMALMNEHEKRPDGIINIPSSQKFAIALSKLKEVFTLPYAQSN